MEIVHIDANRLHRDRTLLGHVFEDFVATEVAKQLGWSKRSCNRFHFRTEAGAEVDLVLEDTAGQLVGIDVKCTATLQRSDFRGLETLAEAAGQKFVRGLVLYTGRAVVPFGEDLRALPIGQLWA